MGTGLGTCPDCKPADDATRGVPPVEVVAEAKSWQSDPVSGVADGNDGQRVGERGHEHVELKLGCPVLPFFPFFGGFRFPYKPLEAKKGAPFLSLGYRAA